MGLSIKKFKSLNLVVFRGARSQKNLMRAATVQHKGVFGSGHFGTHMKLMEKFISDTGKRNPNGTGTATIHGTVARGKVFMDRAAMLKNPNLVRSTFHHEKMHTVPVIGKSEFLAHAWGGLKSKKNTLTPVEAVKEVVRFTKIRPDRAREEAVVAGKAVAGAAAVTGFVWVSINGRPVRIKKRA